MKTQTSKSQIYCPMAAIRYARVLYEVGVPKEAVQKTREIFEEEKKGMEAFLCKKYGAKSAKIEVRQDKALLGGFILQVGSDEYDWSMKGRLNRLEQRLTWR